MLQFLKIYFWQVLRIFLALFGTVLALVIPLYVYSQQSHVLPKVWLEILLSLFSLAGFLAGITAPFLFEYRGRLGLRPLLTEVLLMLIAFAFVGAGLYLGILTGVKVIESAVTSDGTGLAIMFFLLSGAIIGVIPGVLLGALAITIWKLWREARQPSSFAMS